MPRFKDPNRKPLAQQREENTQTLIAQIRPLGASVYYVDTTSYGDAFNMATLMRKGIDALQDKKRVLAILIKRGNDVSLILRCQSGMYINLQQILGVQTGTPFQLEVPSASAQEAINKINSAI